LKAYSCDFAGFIEDVGCRRVVLYKRAAFYKISFHVISKCPQAPAPENMVMLVSKSKLITFLEKAMDMKITPLCMLSETF
jgi:hypothetical protein